MKDDKILQAIGNIDEDLIDRAASADYNCSKGKTVRMMLVPQLRWVIPVTACLVIAVAIAVPTLLKQPPAGNSGESVAGTGNTEFGSSSEIPSGGKEGGAMTGSASSNASAPSPSLSLDGEAESAACYAAPDDWRGLAAENYVLDEQTDGIVSDRIVFKTIDDFAAYADAFVVIPNVHKTAQDGGNMQTSIAEYAESIGDMLSTREWDDRTISTGSRVLIRQRLIGGCTMDEPNNLLRVGGVYLLPIKFNADWGAYEVVGDLDVLFELNDEGKIVSHSQWEGFNKYDGKSFSELVNDVRALYPMIDVEFNEQPISTVEIAKEQVITAYNASGFRKFSVEYVSETVIEGVDVYLFKVTFGGRDPEHAAIAKANGAFIRGEMKTNGDMQVRGGLGSFPW